jgi:hypothetical protein
MQLVPSGGLEIGRSALRIEAGCVNNRRQLPCRAKLEDLIQQGEGILRCAEVELVFADNSAKLI